MENDRFHYTQLPEVPLTLDEIGTTIARLRYDALGKIIASMRAELMRQADSDFARGRSQLASKIEQAVGETDQLLNTLATMMNICRPHLLRELRKEPEIDFSDINKEL